MIKSLTEKKKGLILRFFYVRRHILCEGQNSAAKCWLPFKTFLCGHPQIFDKCRGEFSGHSEYPTEKNCEPTENPA